MDGSVGKQHTERQGVGVIGFVLAMGRRRGDAVTGCILEESREGVMDSERNGAFWTFV